MEGVERARVKGHTEKLGEHKRQRCRFRLARDDPHGVIGILRDVTIGNGRRSLFSGHIESVLQPLNQRDGDRVQGRETLQITHAGIGVIGRRATVPSIAVVDGSTLLITVKIDWKRGSPVLAHIPQLSASTCFTELQGVHCGGASRGNVSEDDKL